MKMIHFKYKGEAVGKGRPRVARRGSYVHTYTPEKTRKFEEALLFEFMAATCEKIPVFEKDKALRADILIGCSIPKSYSKKKHALCVEHKIAPAKKPDVDNILKAIFDALNGYAYEDDSQIVEIKAEKIYTEEPFVEVEIYDL